MTMCHIIMMLLVTCLFLIVLSTANSKDEEYYFRECLKRDDVGKEIISRLSSNGIPAFNKPVSKKYLYTNSI